MSVESGIATFRYSGGLWDKYDVYEVATVVGWQKNPGKVLEFYNMRRKQVFEASPHEGHKALVKFNENYKVQIITQNIDNLHERAGSQHILHLHGAISKARSVKNRERVIGIGSDEIHLGDTADDSDQLRPHVIWFGEAVPMERAIEIVQEAEIFVVIGILPV